MSVASATAPPIHVASAREGAAEQPQPARGGGVFFGKQSPIAARELAHCRHSICPICSGCARGLQPQQPPKKAGRA